MNFILFITAWLLFLPLTIWNYFLVKTDGYFLSSALNLDIYANREFRTLWNKYLRIEDGYHFGYNEETIRIASKYYDSTYHYDNGDKIYTKNNIKNHWILRHSFDTGVQALKNLIDTAVLNNGWLIIATHAESYEWLPESYTNLSEIITYANSVGAEFILPKDGFQIYGNLMESDNGNRINSNCEFITG